MKTIVEKILEQPEKATEEIRSSGVYDFDFGFGEGVNLIFNDYIGFGQYVLTDRHIPQLGDGLKNVQRAGIYAEHLAEKGAKNVPYRKFANLVGDVMNNYHPHGDSSIYNALARMTDVNGSSKIPYFDGSGNLGDKESIDPAGAMRYTDTRLHKNASRILEDQLGFNMIESLATERLEIPEALNSPFPYVFVGLSQEGTAIGLSTSTAIYDVIEVADLITEYLKTGKMTSVLAPDFVTGCYTVQNTKEFTKLMKTGKASVKTRGKVEIRGKEIFLTNFPYGVKQEHLVKEINELELPRVKAYVGTTFGEKRSVRVMCPSKRDVQEVLNQIYLRTSFQKNIHFNSRYLIGKKLISVGLYDGIKEWVNIRKGVLETRYTKELDALRKDASQYEPLVNLLNDKEAHRTFMGIFGNVDIPESEALKFLLDFGCSQDSAEFIMSRTMRSLRDGGRYISRYQGILFSISELEAKLADLNAVIIGQMAEMKAEWGHYKRVSEVTMEDFVKIEREDVPVDTTVLIENNLVSRMEGVYYTNNTTKTIDTRTDKNLIVGLSDGTVHTIKVKDLPVGSPTVVGEPINNSRGQLCKVIFAEIAEEGKELYLYYTNGNISFFDLTPYTKTTNVSKVKVNKLPVDHLPYVSEVGIWTDEVSRRVSIQLSNWEACWMPWADLKHKNSNAVTRVIVPKSNMTQMIAQRYEVEGEWYMDEKYMRQRPVKIANKIVGWNLSAYVEGLVSAAKENADDASLEEINKFEEHARQVIK